MLLLRPLAPLFSFYAARYIEKNATNYRPVARKLTIREHEALGRFFEADLLHRARVANAPLPLPPRVQRLATILRLHALVNPELTAAITFNNVIVHEEPISMRTLFHELVHVEQYKQLRVARFARCYVRGYLRDGKYEDIPLEKHAYELDARYATNPAIPFSVRQEVRNWISAGKY
jgi:hypothetical protein